MVRLHHVLLALLLVGCIGSIEEGEPALDPSEGDPASGAAPAARRDSIAQPTPGSAAGSSPGSTAAGPAAAPIRPPLAGLRRLSRAELDATLAELLLDDSRLASRRLPEENIAVDFAFDNDADANSTTSESYLTALEALVTEAVTAALREPSRRARILPCKPASVSDAACMKASVADFGRRALRRPLDADEQTLYQSFARFATEAGDFDVGLAAAMRAMLLSPELLYRIELGTPVPGSFGLVKLTSHEMAARLSFTLLGSTPDRALLDEAARGLDTTDRVRAVATRLVADPRARSRVQHWHSYWLGYQGNLSPDLAAAMLEETNTLINDVVFDNPRDYRELFLSERTFVGDLLRRNYKEIGAPLTGKAGWVSYGQSGRRGILSHGSVLGAFNSGGDTSVTKRGIFVRVRLLCDVVIPPPPDVDVDVKPAAGQCKTGPTGFLTVTHQETACRACHDRLDPIGFGLERYDVRGRLRSFDDGKPQCPIDDRGTLAVVERGELERIPFRGPGQLALALANTGKLEPCVVRHLFRFATGRMDEDADGPAIAALSDAFAKGKRGFAGLLVDLVSSDFFAHGRLAP